MEKVKHYCIILPKDGAVLSVGTSEGVSDDLTLGIAERDGATTGIV